ncbi:hypothetical protein FA95DRAFT_362760 [Auriscalpium vulgare]|uniref:Uncharacterized protein n=1 Tax=Auriscalpium vulgare TaxID=40419 RepID=A0ACB8RID6_9AGAM|nr:hypothetical protein FA95DRAFT_362760 [Auriscalpium vulgare]
MALQRIQLQRSNTTTTMSPDPDNPASPPLLPVILTTSPSNDPPPPYPSRERRARAGTGRHPRRPTSASQPPESDAESHAHPFPAPADQAGEHTPLLSPRRVRQGSSAGARPRTVSQSSTVFSGASASPSLAQTVVSAFRLDLDSDMESEDGEEDGGPVEASAGAGPQRQRHAHVRRGTEESADAEDDELGPSLSRRKVHGWRARWRRYFRPMGRRAYWVPLVHLLLLNFPYALLAWIYLFVFTLLGTILLVVLPLGALLCFFDLLGARSLARGEVLLQSTFHGPLAYNLEYPPIFTRRCVPTSAEAEAGVGTRYEHSFYRNSYSMFTDPTSYQALFYFLVIKPGITLLLSLFVIVLVPVSLVLVFPAPAMLRLVRRLGIWQANVAVEGLYVGV